LGSDVSSCNDLLAETPPKPDSAPAQPDPSHLGGWVAIAFSLKGDGRASELHILDFEPKDDGTFAQWAVQGLKRAKYKPGAVRDHCVSIGSFYRR